MALPLRVASTQSSDDVDRQNLRQTFPRRSPHSPQPGGLSMTASIGARHPQDMLTKIVEGHLLRDWRNLVETDLAVQAFHIKLARVAKTTKGLHSVIHGITAGI